MDDKPFTSKSVMLTLLNKLTVGGMFHDLSAQSVYHAVQELLLADEEYDAAVIHMHRVKTRLVDGNYFDACDRLLAANDRRAAAIRAMRG